MSHFKLSPEQRALIGRTKMDGASRDDVEMFCTTCERTGLDPFAGQIMPNSRNTRKGDNWVTIWNYIVTVDGFRVVAVNTGEYEGQEGPFWCGPDGVWKDLWLDKTPPSAAKVIVYRKGFRTGLVGIARFDAYAQKTRDGKLNQVWATLGDHMNAKCAEVLALRKAFPNDLSGLISEEEKDFIDTSDANETADRALPPQNHKDAPQIPDTNEKEEGTFVWTKDDKGILEDLLGQGQDLCQQVGLTSEQETKWEARYRGQMAQGDEPQKVFQRIGESIRAMQEKLIKVPA